MHLLMVIIPCMSGYFGLITLDLVFRERVQLKWLPFWLILTGITMFFALALVARFPQAPMVIFSVIPLVLLNWWMLSYMIHAKKILLLPVVLLVNALYRFIGAITGMLINFMAANKQNTILMKGYFGKSATAMINMVGSTMTALPLVIICGLIAHHYARKYNFVTLLEELPADGYDYMLMGTFSALYLIVFTVALQHPVQWQAYAASVFTIGFAALYLQLIVSKNKRVAANQALQNLNTYGHALSDLNTNLETFSHDYKNIMLGMTEMIDHGDIDQLQSYFKDEIQPTLQQFVTHSAVYKQLDDVSDDYVRGILFEKLNQAAQRHVRLNIVINQQIDFPSMEHLNLIRILGNLLDNAIDEASTAGKIVDVVISQTESEVKIRINNQIAVNRTIDVTKLAQKYATNKKQHQGLGLTSIQRAQTSEIWVTTIIESHIFSTTIHIAKSGSHKALPSH